MYCFIISGSGSRHVSRVWVVRKPSCTLKKGISVASAQRRAIRHRSPDSCALRANSMPQPVSATAITSSWPACTLRAWLVSARAPMLNTAGWRLPLMT
jgi:hypothetical protein